MNYQRSRPAPDVARAALLRVAQDPSRDTRLHLLRQAMPVDSRMIGEVCDLVLANDSDGMVAAAAIMRARSVGDSSQIPVVKKWAYSNFAIARENAFSFLTLRLGNEFDSFATEYLRSGPQAGRLRPRYPADFLFSA